MDAPALAQLRAQQLNAALRRQFLPRGTNSNAPKSIPNHSSSGVRLEKNQNQKLVDVNKQRPSFCIATEVNNHRPSLMKKQAFMRARHNQTIRGQAETVEQHMSMTKPVNHRYPEPIKAHDRAEDWKRENHIQNKRQDNAYLKSLRAALDTMPKD